MRRGPTVVWHVPGRGVTGRLRAALDEGRSVVLLSKRDTDLRRALAALEGPAPTGISVRLGDGRTATMLCAEGVPVPYAYWPRPKPQPVWKWACRACGTIDERWTWRDMNEAAPMVRQAYDLNAGELVDVPWSCPRSGCAGAARWHVSRPESSAAQLLWHAAWHADP